MRDVCVSQLRLTSLSIVRGLLPDDWTLPSQGVSGRLNDASYAAKWLLLSGMLSRPP
jgi:hypothetical protein